MNDFIVAQLGKLYEKEMASRSNEDYEPNEKQLEKFIKTMKFFQKCIAESKDAHLEHQLIPKETVGGLTCECYLIYLCREDIKEFAEILSWCSAITIEALEDGKVVISLTIPDVFTKKHNYFMN